MSAPVLSVKETRWRLGEIMVQKEWITWHQLEEALKLQVVTRRLIGEILVERKVVSRRNVYRALAMQHHIPFVDLERSLIEPKALEAVPKWLILTHRIMPLEVGNGLLYVATANPSNFWLKALLQRATDIDNVCFVLACPEDLSDAIRRYYGMTIRAA
ncbi:MAG: hypothetical protein Q8R76_04270 [Candidatus Omnitrophota bacterium]|nr:hypothetical protein [Candidatus Omnitrophota bacterium]